MRQKPTTFADLYAIQQRLLHWGVNQPMVFLWVVHELVDELPTTLPSIELFAPGCIALLPVMDETSGPSAAKSQMCGLPVLVVQVLRAILPNIHYRIVCAGSLLPGPFDNVSATLLLRSDFTE